MDNSENSSARESLSIQINCTAMRDLVHERASCAFRKSRRKSLCSITLKVAQEELEISDEHVPKVWSRSRFS